MKKLILSIAVITTAFITSCGGGASDPKAVAKSFLEAQQKADYTTAKKFCTEETAGLLDMAAALGTGVPDSIKKMESAAKLTLQDAKIDGEKATIAYTISSKPDAQSINLVKKDGKWLVAQSKDPGAAAPGTPIAETPAAKEEAMPVPAKK